MAKDWNVIVGQALANKETKSELLSNDAFRKYLEAENKRNKRNDFLYALRQFFGPLILGILLGSVLSIFLLSVFSEYKFHHFIAGVLTGFLLSLMLIKKIGFNE